jgi:RNA polymerase sigma-70 factor (ECF subfamily)
LHPLKSGTIYKYQNVPDAELVDRYREMPDPEVLGELYQRYMVLVYGVCMKYLRSREDSQDAVMQIYETLVREIPRFEIRHFKSWLYGVSRNHCLMKLRKDSSERLKQVKISSEMVMESDSINHLMEEKENEMMQERLKACMEQLKEEQRQCVELFYYSQRCYREIAAELALEENKVKSFIQNGKRNLKICIDSKTAVKNVRN